MEKDALIALRKKLKMNKNIPLRIIVNENYYIDERTSVVTWDDANGELLAYCPNPERETQVQCPGSIHATSYDNIACIQAYYSVEDMKAMLDKAVADKLTNESSASKIIKQISDFSNVNMYTDAKTTEESGAYSDRVNWASKTNNP